MLRRQQSADRAVRPAMRSPGRPHPPRQVEQEFWRRIAEGMATEDAGAAAGVSSPVAYRWFRHGGGMPPITLDPPSGRYLSLAEREEIAILNAQAVGVREIARHVGRHPSTISRDPAWGQVIHESHQIRETAANPATQPQASHHEHLHAIQSSLVSRVWVLEASKGCVHIRD